MNVGSTFEQRDYLAYNLGEAIDEFARTITVLANSDAHLDSGSVFWAHLSHGMQHLNWFYHGVTEPRSNYDLSMETHKQWSRFPECFVDRDGFLIVPIGFKIPDFPDGDLEQRMQASAHFAASITKLTSILLALNTANGKIPTESDLVDSLHEAYLEALLCGITMLGPDVSPSLISRTPSDVQIKVPNQILEMME